MTDPSVRFDLRTEPWIPVIDKTGAGVELGIRETLARSHELRGIANASPLVEVALHRLLLAVLHRVVDGPRSPDDWQRLWVRGRFDEPAIDAYLGRFADRFDLFGTERPFYQDAGLIAAGLRVSPIVKLAHEFASEGNAPLLFDHTVDGSFDPATAARYLVAHQVFSLGGTVTRTPGSTNPSAASGPSARAAHFRVSGTTLFETLTWNLVRYEPAADVPVPVIGEADLPAWERAAAPTGAVRQPTGYLDVLTWQSDRVQLAAPDADGAVTGAVIIAGDRIDPGRELSVIEPTMLAFASRGSKAGPTQLREVRMSATRSLWRDSTVLIAVSGADPGWRRPTVLDWAAELAWFGFGGLGETHLVPLEAGGLVGAKAKTLLWRREGMSLPTAALRDPARAEQIRIALRAAERIGAMLGDGTVDSAGADKGLPRPLARIAIALLGTKEHPPRPEAIRTFISGTGAAPRYWSALSTPFALLLNELAAADAAADPDAERTAAVDHWADAVRAAARDAFVRATSGFGGVTRALFAVADGERAFNAGIARVLGASHRPQEVTPA